MRDISSVIEDLNPRCLSRVDIVAKLKSADTKAFPVVASAARLGPCVDPVGKIICIGYNSRLHAEEMASKPATGGEMPVFFKPSSAACGANDPIIYSRFAGKLDWEAELGVVIGKKGKYIGKSAALAHILGYTCFNDVSDRYWQFEKDDKQYTKGKGFDSFAPIGPYLVTKDEVADAGDLDVKLWVNGQLRQDFNTSDYINSAEDVVSYLSRFFTLYPGDVIAMGSAPGNARSWGEDKFLKPGDRVRLEIESLGVQEQTVTKE
jgi:2-keto-4-pentenoate hydratase/2-oxohepta-3-ene-1,7-dioic acid hydratase in catechol pathway